MRSAFLNDLASAFVVPTLEARGLRAAAELCARYRDVELGLADASIVELAARFSTRQLATFDKRHFGFGSSLRSPRARLSCSRRTPPADGRALAGFRPRLP
jgi:hypothetical protein